MSIYRDGAVQIGVPGLLLVRASEPRLCIYCCQETYWFEPFTKIAACSLEHLLASTVPGAWDWVAGEQKKLRVQ